MIQVFLVKRFLKKRRQNGRREFRWALRWEAPDGWKCESTGTADSTEADAKMKVKWAQLNAIVETPPEPEPEPVKASWQECRDALERAMRADNCRSNYIYDAVLMFDTLRKMFPEAAMPADVTPEVANEFKRRRAEVNNSPWSTKGDLATLRAVFGKWLTRECGLLEGNPFAGVKPPKCDEPDVRIVSAAESNALFAWLAERWNDWKLPAVYLEVASLLGWRATETASIREEDLLSDGFVRVTAVTSKTRKTKYGWLPADLYDRVQSCTAGGWAFGRFSDELRRLMLLWMRKPNLAARVKDFSPKRLVGWMQDELKRFNDELAGAVEEGKPLPERFTMHDFRRTAITGLQMAGVSENEASIMCGVTPEVIRRHYEKLDGMAIAKRSIERRLSVVSDVAGTNPTTPFIARRLRAEPNAALDGASDLPETATA